MIMTEDSPIDYANLIYDCFYDIIYDKFCHDYSITQEMENYLYRFLNQEMIDYFADLMKSEIHNMVYGSSYGYIDGDSGIPHGKKTYDRIATYSSPSITRNDILTIVEKYANAFFELNPFEKMSLSKKSFEIIEERYLNDGSILEMIYPGPNYETSFYLYLKDKKINMMNILEMDLLNKYKIFFDETAVTAFMKYINDLKNIDYSEYDNEVAVIKCLENMAQVDKMFEELTLSKDFGDYCNFSEEQIYRIIRSNGLVNNYCDLNLALEYIRANEFPELNNQSTCSNYESICYSYCIGYMQYYFAKEDKYISKAIIDELEEYKDKSVYYINKNYSNLARTLDRYKYILNEINDMVDETYKFDEYLASINYNLSALVSIDFSNMTDSSSYNSESVALNFIEDLKDSYLDNLLRDYPSAVVGNTELNKDKTSGVILTKDKTGFIEYKITDSTIVYWYAKSISNSTKSNIIINYDEDCNITSLIDIFDKYPNTITLTDKNTIDEENFFVFDETLSVYVCYVNSSDGLVYTNMSTVLPDQNTYAKISVDAEKKTATLVESSTIGSIGYTINPGTVNIDIYNDFCVLINDNEYAYYELIDGKFEFQDVYEIDDYYLEATIATVENGVITITKTGDYETALLPLVDYYNTEYKFDSDVATKEKYRILDKGNVVGYLVYLKDDEGKKVYKFMSCNAYWSDYEDSVNINGFIDVETGIISFTNISNDKTIDK